MKKLRLILIPLFALLFSVTACYNNSPEKLPKYKKKFRAQITSFENQKEKADKKLAEGVEELTDLQTGLKEALDNQRKVDKEFDRVYGQWQQVDRQVKSLYKEYESLKADAENLFSAMESQTASLNNSKTRGELTSAITKTKDDYLSTLGNTEKAIDRLRALHDEAVDIVKALEVAVAIGQFDEINDGLKSIEDRVEIVMGELNKTIVESKDLYEKKIQSL